MTSAVPLAALAAAVLLAAPQAPAVDPDLVARWSTANVVRYHLVGVYDGPAVIAHDEPAGQATVTDRVELDVDWSLRTGTMNGEAKVVNAASTVRDLRNTHVSCPPPRPEGGYEHLTVTAVVVTGGTLELKGTRSFPVVAVVAGCQGVEEPRKVAAWEQEVFERLIVPSPLMLAAPPGTDPNLTVSDDKASFTIRSGPWTWTYTPTLVN